MRVLLLIILFINLSAGVVWAKTYSCRDSSGQLHFSDNLQGLPEECLGKEKVVKPGPADNLNYVPATPVPQGSGIEFKHSVRAVERELQAEESQKRQLHSRAESLLENYRAAVAEKRQAKRSWSYSSRDKIKQADSEIAQARTGKQQLLDELDDAIIPAKEKAAVRTILEGIDPE